MNNLTFIFICLTTIYGLSYGEKGQKEKKENKCDFETVFDAPEYKLHCNTSLIHPLPPLLDNVQHEMIYLCAGIRYAVSKFCKSNAQLDKGYEVNLVKSNIIKELRKAVDEKQSNVEQICTDLSNTLSNSSYKKIMNYGKDSKNSSAILDFALLNKTLNTKCVRLCTSAEVAVETVKPLCPILLWVNRVLVNSTILTSIGDEALKITTKSPMNDDAAASKPMPGDGKPSNPVPNGSPMKLPSPQDNPQVPESSMSGKSKVVVDKPGPGTKKQVGDDIQHEGTSIKPPAPNEQRQKSSKGSTGSAKNEPVPPKLDSEQSPNAGDGAIPSHPNSNAKVNEIVGISSVAAKVSTTEKAPQAPNNFADATVQPDQERKPDISPENNGGDDNLYIGDGNNGGGNNGDGNNEDGNNGVQDPSAKKETDRIDKDNKQGPGSFVAPPPPAMDPPQHFFTYFMALCVICIICYIAYHKKNMILALLFEGPRSRGRSRPNTRIYQKLDCTLEEAVSSQCNNSNVTHVIY